MPTVIPGAWSGALPPTRNQFVSKIASTFGYDGSDTDLAAKCLEWLDETVNDLNMNTWECTRVAESGIVFTEGQQWINLNPDAFKASQAYLVHNTDGDQAPLHNLPWVTFKRLYWATNKTGRPCEYTIFNPQRDGKIYFDTLVDLDTVDNYTLAVEYYSRIPKFSVLGVNEAPEIPAEFESVILNGSLKRGAIHFDDRRVGTFGSLEAEALDRLKRIDSLQPDADRRWRLIDEISYL